MLPLYSISSSLSSLTPPTRNSFSIGVAERRFRRAVCSRAAALNRLSTAAFEVGMAHKRRRTPANLAQE